MLTALLHGLIALLVVVQVGILPIVAQAAVDLGEYRQILYGGPPTHYCDPTRPLASNGTGTSGDPWNMTQCQTQPVAGNVVGIMAGVSVSLAAPNNDKTPAFTPTNQGTNDTIRSGRIVYVTQWPAIALANVETNALRTEFRHAGTDEDGHTQNTGTGGPMLGVWSKNYVTFDGFYIDMAQAYIKEDSGLLRVQESRGTVLRNWVVKGTGTHVWSNPVLYRPQDAVDTVLSNFRAYGFNNTSDFGQVALFSDQYGDQNFLIEHGDIHDLDRGIFLKGSGFAGLGSQLNYGTIQYMLVYNTSSPFQFNALHASNLSYLRYSLAYNTTFSNVSPRLFQADGIVFQSISPQGRNLTIDHVTIAKVDSTDSNMEGALVAYSNGIGSGVTITNSIFDLKVGSFGKCLSLLTTLPDVMNNNFCYANGGTERWRFNGTTYTTLASWKSAVQAVNPALETASLQGASSPFTDWTNNNYRVVGGHAAKTASTTGGELGAYATSEVIGPDTVDSGAGSGGGARFSSFNMRKP